MRLAGQKKVDIGQSAIVELLSKSGFAVQSLAQIGAGCPDLLVAIGGRMWLLEVKTGSAKLNDDQKAWHSSWPAPIAVVRSLEEAQEWAAKTRVSVWKGEG